MIDDKNKYKCFQCSWQIPETKIDSDGLATCPCCGAISNLTGITDDSPEVEEHKKNFSEKELSHIKVEERDGHLKISWQESGIISGCIVLSFPVILMGILIVLIGMSIISDIKLFIIMLHIGIIISIIAKLLIGAIPGYIIFLCIKSAICSVCNTTSIEVNNSEINFFYGPYWKKTTVFKLCEINKLICKRYDEQHTNSKGVTSTSFYYALTVLLKNGDIKELYGRDIMLRALFIKNIIDDFLGKINFTGESDV